MKTVFHPLRLVPLAVIAFSCTGLAFAQSDSGDQSRNQERRSRNQQGERDDSQRQRMRQETGQQQNNMSSERRAALKHYRAGYYAGYRRGYNDGSDGYVLYLFGDTDQQSAQSGQSQRSRDGSQRQSSRGRGLQQVSGEILRLKRIPLRNTNIQHTAVLLKTNDGKRRVVDLGPTQNLRQLDLQEGDQVSVRGGIVRIGDSRIFFARQVRSDGETVNVTYRRQERQSDSANRRQSQGTNNQRQQSSRQRQSR